MDYSFDVVKDALKLTKGWVFEDVGSYNGFRFRHIETNVPMVCALFGDDVSDMFGNIMFGDNGISKTFSYTKEKIAETLDIISLLIDDVGDYDSWYNELWDGDFLLTKDTIVNSLDNYQMLYAFDSEQKGIIYEFGGITYCWGFLESSVILIVENIRYRLPYRYNGTNEFPILPNKMMRELKLSLLI
jgi:hypothetical protein